MAVIKPSVVKEYYKLCVDLALQSRLIEFVVNGGLICEKPVETFDEDGNLRFRFLPPTTRVATEHWEFRGELHLHEQELRTINAVFSWLEQFSDYLCLATAGAPVRLEPFRDCLSEQHKLPENHPREIWYDEIKIGRALTIDTITRANTFMHLAQHRTPREKIKSYRRSLWWFRHGANVEMESPLLAYVCFFNSLEILLQYDKSNDNQGKPKQNNKTKRQFKSIFSEELGTKLYLRCYGDKPNSLYDIRCDIDHGKIVELGSQMLMVLENTKVLKAVVVDLALHWIDVNESFGGWLVRSVLEQGHDALIILSQDEAKELGYPNGGSIIQVTPSTGGD